MADMPVNATHPEYDAALPEWSRARDVPAGEHAVKAAAEHYPTRLESQNAAAYSIRYAHQTASNYFFHLDSRCPGAPATICEKIL